MSDSEQTQQNQSDGLSKERLEKKAERARRTRDFIDTLTERYPQCFSKDPEKIRPLAIGIQKALREDLGTDEVLKDEPGWLVRQALAVYTRGYNYHKAVVDARPRVNLDGTDAGEIGEQEKAHAQEQMAQIEKARAARRPKRPAGKRGGPRKPRKDEAPSVDKLQKLANKFNH